MQENRIVEPNFIVHDDGRVSCTKHTWYNKSQERRQPLLPPIFNLLGTPPQPTPLTCKTCGHYFDDSCYFAPVSINQIMDERDRGHIKCDFCGDRIERSMGVLQQIYYKNKYRVKMPLICCTCYAHLKDNKFLDKAWSRLLILFAGLGFAIILILYNLTFFMSLGIFTPSVIIFGFGIWIWLTYAYARKMFRTWHGQRNYTRLEAQFKKIETGDEQ